MDFNKARTFVEVVNYGGVSAAANHLFRSQQAISQQLILLEEELKIKLFDRHGPKLFLTEAGEELYEVFEPQFAAIEKSVTSLKADKARASGLIRIGIWAEQSMVYIPEMIRIFSETYPMVDFHLEIGLDKDLEEKIISNQLNMAFLVHAENKKLLDSRAVYRQPLLPVVSRQFLSTRSAPKSIEETLEFPLVDYIGEYSCYNSWIKKNARELLPLAKKKRPLVTITNGINLKHLVMQGLGFGFLNQEIIQPELEAGELVPILSDFRYEPLIVEIDLVHKHKHSFGYVHKEFVDVVIESSGNWKYTPGSHSDNDKGQSVKG